MWENHGRKLDGERQSSSPSQHERDDPAADDADANADVGIGGGREKDEKVLIVEADARAREKEMIGKEMIGGLLDSLPEQLNEKIRSEGLLKCLFCGAGFGEVGELMEHISGEHGGEIQGMMTTGEGAPEMEGLDSLLGNLGQITSMLLSQLGPALGDPGNSGKVFSAMFTPQSEWHEGNGGEEDEEMPDLPDIGGIMEIAMEMGLNSGGVVEEEEDDGQAADGSPVEECPSCGNFKKIGGGPCPFCRRDGFDDVAVNEGKDEAGGSGDEGSGDEGSDTTE